MKQTKKINAPYCYAKPGEPFKFPCKFNGLIFYDVEDMEEYFTDNNDNKNASRKEFFLRNSDTKRKLMKEWMYAKKIPSEYRIYDTNSGKIYDIRKLKETGLI